MYARLRSLKEFAVTHPRTIGGVLIASLLCAGVWWILSPEGKLSPLDRIQFIEAIQKDDWIEGDPKTARATLIIYSDFSCTSCATYYDILTQLKADTKSDIALVFRHYPLTATHPHAALAAQAAEAAGRQGKFFAMHDELFRNQREWVRSENPQENFLSYARALGLDEAQFESDLNAQSTRQHVEGAEKLAQKLELKNAPTFFINGEELPPMRTYAEFKTAVLSRTYKE